jgi:monothiol glutaredoxin
MKCSAKTATNACRPAKDSALAFLCHHGNSSRQAAEYFRSLGFHDLYNVEGGIEAWAAD